MTILEALQEGKRVIVCDVFIFQGTHMECIEGHECCSSDYDTLEEAAGWVMFYAEDDPEEVEIL